MSAFSHFDDLRLFSLISAGNHDAFAELVTRHTDRFFSLALRTLGSVDDAHDVVQQAFINVWSRPSSWQPAKAKFTTWFYRVILNACHDIQRRRRRQLASDPMDMALHAELAHESDASIADVAEQIARDQTAAWQSACVQRWIKALPSAQRDAINLVVYAELPQRDAADVLGLSLKALESLLVRAKRNLSEQLAVERAVYTRQTSSLGARTENGVG